MNSAQARGWLTRFFRVSNEQIDGWARREPHLNYVINVAPQISEERLREIVERLFQRTGKSQEQAALYLGITPASFQNILDAGLLAPSIFRGTEYYLEGQLDAFMGRFLPGNLLFSTVTAQRRSFIGEFNRVQSRSGVQIEAQECAYGDGYIAQEICANPDCVPGQSSRLTCLAHAIMVDSRRPAYLRPAVVCVDCARALLGIQPGQRPIRFFQNDDSIREMLRRRERLLRGRA